MKLHVDESIQQSDKWLLTRLDDLCLKPTTWANLTKHGSPKLQALFLIYKNERALRHVTLGAVVNCDWLIIVSELSAKFPNVAILVLTDCAVV